MPDALRLFGMAAGAIWRREVTHFWREKTRVLGFAASPLLFWLVIGAGFSDLTYFFPGALLMSVMFTAVFSTMSVIEDRREGFLLSVLASPAPRCAFVTGKVAGGATMAAVQGLLFLPALLAVEPRALRIDFVAVLLALLLTGFSFTALGFWMAWRSRTPQGFHALMNVVLMPLWMISGALFPPERAQAWMRALMQWNPLRYFLDVLVRALTPWNASPDGGLLPALLTASAGLLFLTLAIFDVERRPQGVE